jgi:hypothetical protein
VALLLAVVTLTGCAGGSQRVNEGAGAGAVIGAGLGLLIGALRGEPAAGLAVGAAVGAGQGAYEGWRQEQDDDRTRELADAIRNTDRGAGVEPSDRAREELTRFLGVWTMEGWVQEPGEERLDVRAQVNGTVEMSYFVELAYIDIEVAGHEGRIWGTSTLGYDDDAGYSMSSRFNTVPEPVRAAGGRFDAADRTFLFEGRDWRVLIRFDNPDRFVAETILTSGGQEVTVESYRFTKS